MAEEEKRGNTTCEDRKSNGGGGAHLLGSLLPQRTRQFHFAEPVAAHFFFSVPPVVESDAGPFTRTEHLIGKKHCRVGSSW